MFTVKCLENIHLKLRIFIKILKVVIGSYSVMNNARLSLVFNFSNI